MNVEAAAAGLLHVKQRLRRAYVQLLVAHPPTAMQLAGLGGRVTDRWSKPEECIPAQLVGQLFDDKSPRQWATIARRIRAQHLRNRGLEYLCELAGSERLDPFVTIRGAERLQRLHEGRQPAILLLWHVGPHVAALAALQRLGIPVLFLAREWVGFRLPPSFRVLPISGNAAERAFALKHALRWLRDGGLVAIAGDGQDGGTGIDASCLGRRYPFRRGPAVLARLSGAPVMPLVCSWSAFERRMVVTLHDALARPACEAHEVDAFEQGITESAARWLDGYLRARPAAFQQLSMRDFLSAPRIGDADGPQATDPSACDLLAESPR
jgi:lauroyl/myristoyl acyltransferase